MATPASVPGEQAFWMPPETTVTLVEADASPSVPVSDFTQGVTAAAPVPTTDNVGSLVSPKHGGVPAVPADLVFDSTTFPAPQVEQQALGLTAVASPSALGTSATHAASLTQPQQVGGHQGLQSDADDAHIVVSPLSQQPVQKQFLEPPPQKPAQQPAHNTPLHSPQQPALQGSIDAQASQKAERALPFGTPVGDVPRSTSPGGRASRRPSAQDATWVGWMEHKIKMAKQVLHERMGSAQPTTDTEMDERVQTLKATQSAYRNVLRLATAFNTHLHGMVQAQKEMASAFNELAMHQPELYEDFQQNYEAQKSLYRNGTALLGALSFFVDNLDTFVFTTIEDTLETWEEYQRARLEFDADRSELFHLRRTTAEPAGTVSKKVQIAQQEFEAKQARFALLREALATKLSLLEANKVRVMTKQLNLYRNAIHAYFTGNKANLDKLLAESHLRPTVIDDVPETPTSQSWLDRLHDDLAGVIAPRSPALTPTQSGQVTAAASGSASNAPTPL